STGENIHVVAEGEGWSVIRENSKEVLDTKDRKEDAIDVGREVARTDGVELVIYNEDGSVDEKKYDGNGDKP
ncbi:MAG TPA: DUF2188 domain-containing protein, partial [Ignavibacteria bacterium]|nr:DUF2188 domain-containing protein [Ignavibacteria bacterium]